MNASVRDIHRAPARTRVDSVIVVEGVVEHGDERGRLLGFPTANVIGTDAVRLDGVYAGTVHIDPKAGGPTFVAAVSVGHRPTYYGKDGQRLLEAHLLGFIGDLYGREVRIELHTRLRPQHKYVDSATLVRQLHIDVEDTRVWARGAGLTELLVVDRPNDARWHRGRWGLIQPRKIRDREAAARLRAARRNERISQAVQAVAPNQLTHQWVATQTGLPIRYLVWRFPTIKELRAAAATQPPG